MFCPSCGIALTQQLKYCNRCGAQLNNPEETALIELYEKRMDSEMEGLFWITILGLGLLLGGLFVLKKALGLSEGLLFAYMILCSTGLMMYFGLGVWQIRRLAQSSKEASGRPQLRQVETKELDAARPLATLEPASSVTEHTTRTLEPVHRRSTTSKETA
jgi:hypothetical protein